MSKMGQYVIELTEKRLPSIMDIQIETDVPLPKQNQPLPNLLLDDLLMGQSFFLTRGEDSDQRRKWVEALRQKVTRFQRRHQNQKKFSVQGSEGRRRGHESALHQSAGDADQ